jgi:uncharacterized membrane protein
MTRADRGMTTTVWILTAVVLVVLLTARLLPAAAAIALLAVTQIAFTLLHGARRYGWRAVVAFYALTLIVSNAFENLSIVTGLPFGDYHYSDDLGAKLFLVPLVIGPTYAATGYLAWTMATVLLGDVRRGSAWLTTVGTPFVATFAMVLWDVALDPTAATVQQRWIWENGGGFFGVPLVNYLGWSLTVYTFLLLFALYLRYRSPHAVTAPESPRAHLAQAVLLYAATAGRLLENLFFGERTVVTDALGRTWRTGDIYEASAITLTYGMFFVTALVALRLAQHPSTPASATA